MYNTFAMGRSERVWGDNCEEFRPERWLVDGVFRGKNPFEYPVFHAGPRMCLGKDMAFVQMKATAASIVKRFDMEERGKHQVSMTLRNGRRIACESQGNWEIVAIELLVFYEVSNSVLLLNRE